MPVDRKDGSGQRRRTQGDFRSSARARRASGHIAAEHFDIGHHVMTPGHRLCGLQMGEAGHDPIGAVLGLRHQRAFQRLNPERRPFGHGSRV